MPQINGNKYTYEMVSEMLKGYNDLNRKALQLEFEITHYVPLATGEDIIEEMNFGKPEGDVVSFLQKSHVSDKTAKIAVTYEEQSTRLNIKHKEELETELRDINMEMLGMEYYVGLLGEKHSHVLRLLYFEGLTLGKAAESTKVSLETAKNYRKAGILRLVDIYSMILC